MHSHFDRAVIDRPGRAAGRGLIVRARAMERRQRPEAAAALYHRADRYPGVRIAARLGLSRCLARTNQWPVVPQALLAAVAAGARRFSTLFDGGNLLLGAGRYEDAIRMYREAGRRKHPGPDQRVDARLHFNTAYAFAQLDRPFAAARAYERSLEIAPDNVDAWFNLGSAYSRTGALRRGRDAYERVVELEAADHEAWNNLGNACAALKDDHAAEAAFTTALSLCPSYHAAWNNLGNVLQTLGRHKEAIRCYDRAIMLQSGDEVITRFNRALSLLSSGQVREGLRDLHGWALMAPLPDSGSLPSRGPDWARLFRSLSSADRRDSAG